MGCDEYRLHRVLSAQQTCEVVLWRNRAGARRASGDRMHSHRRLTIIAGVVLCVGTACQRDTGDAPDQRRADTATTPNRTSDACAPNGRVPAVTSAGIGVARIGAAVREVAQACTTRDTTFT